LAESPLGPSVTGLAVHQATLEIPTRGPATIEITAAVQRELARAARRSGLGRAERTAEGQRTCSVSAS
jgi:hypothetical protein